MKGVMTWSFVEHPVRGLLSFKQIAVYTNKVHPEDFLKPAVLNRSAEGSMTNSFWK